MYCEPNFTFSLQDKRTLTAVEEDVFDIDWPWPSQLACGWHRDLKKNDINEGSPPEKRTRSVGHSFSTPPQDTACASGNLDGLLKENGQEYVENERRDCNNTTILSLHIDPLHYEEITIPLPLDSPSGTSPLILSSHSSSPSPESKEDASFIKAIHSHRRTRAVAAVLSAGRRVYLPLLPFSSDSQRRSSSPPLASTSSSPPHMYWEFPPFAMLSTKGRERSSCNGIASRENVKKVSEEEIRRNSASTTTKDGMKEEWFDAVHSARSLPPHFGEVLVGELSVIRLLTKTLQENKSEWDAVRLALQTEALGKTSSKEKESDRILCRGEWGKPRSFRRRNEGCSDSCSLLSSLQTVHSADKASRKAFRSLTKGTGKGTCLSTVDVLPYRWPKAADGPDSSRMKKERPENSTGVRSRVETKDTSVLPVVYHYFLSTIPYKTLWMLNGLLLLSLPCEERLITLHPSPPVDVEDHPSHPLGVSPSSSLHVVPQSTSRRTVGGVVELRCCPLLGSFSLPRGVVPLDIVELSHRAAVAVGTMAHGVLLCALDTFTGVVQYISQTFSVAGLGSSVFPVTRLAAIFPALVSSSVASRAAEHAEIDKPGEETLRNSEWQQVVEWNRQCQARGGEAGGAVRGGGMLLVTSIFETQSFVIRLSPTGGGDGVLEECPKELKHVSIEILFSSSQSEVYRGVGVLLVNFGRGLYEVQCVLQDDVDAGEKKQEEDENQEGEITHATGKKVLPFSCSSPEESDRCSPFGSWKSCGLPLEKIRVVRSITSGASMMLTRLSDGPPIYQRLNESSTYQGQYSKHFILAADACNRIHLLDRRLNGYTRHLPSTITVTPPLTSSLSFRSDLSSSLTSEKGENATTDGETSFLTPLIPFSSQKQREKSKMDSKNKRSRKDSIPERQEDHTDPQKNDSGGGAASTTSLSVALSTSTVVAAEDAIVGIVVFEARAGGFYAAVAHHKRCLSILHYSSLPAKRIREGN